MAAILADDLWVDDLDGLRTRVAQLEAIIDPHRTGRRAGAPGASVDATDELERIYQAHRGAESVITGEPAIPDSESFRARQLLRDTWASYGRDAPLLAAQATNPEIFNADLDTQVARASANLVMILGGLTRWEWEQAGRANMHPGRAPRQTLRAVRTLRWTSRELLYGSSPKSIEPIFSAASRCIVGVTWL